MEKLFSDPSLKNQNGAYLWINSLRKVLYSFFFFLVCQVEGYLKILKLNCKPLVFTSYKAFSKKQRIGTNLLISFSAWLLKKSISFVMCFRVRSRSPMTFKTKLSVTTVNSSFQVIPIFVIKSSILDIA